MSHCRKRSRSLTASIEPNKSHLKTIPVTSESIAMAAIEVQEAGGDSISENQVSLYQDGGMEQQYDQLRPQPGQ